MINQRPFLLILILGLLGVCAFGAEPAALPTVEVFTLNNCIAGEPATFRLTRTEPLNAPLIVKLRTLEGGTADGGVHYRLPQQVLIPAGQSEARFAVPTFKADKPPFTRTFAISIAPDPQYAIGRFDCDGVIVEWGAPAFRGLPEGFSSNTDDDNKNGTEDRLEVGHVEGEDDLYPVELVMPPVLINDTLVTLTITRGNLRIWESADKSGRCLANSAEPVCVWQVGRTTPMPRTIWIEKISSVAPGGSALTFSVQEPPAKLWKNFPPRLQVLYPQAHAPQAPLAAAPPATNATTQSVPAKP